MARKTTSPDDTLTTEQAAAELGISISRMLILLKDGRLPATRHGWAWVIRRADLDAVRHRPTGRPPTPRTIAKAQGDRTAPAPKKKPKK